MEIYEPLQKSLYYVGAVMDAAETHGVLCGLLCASPPPFNEDLWFRTTLGQTSCDDQLAKECQRQLILLKAYTLSQLSSPHCDFTLVLPEDEKPLTERVQALGGWCEGFLFGLRQAHLHDRPLSQSAQEFIQDVISISRIAPLEQESEEGESNFTQVVEYLRVGVLTLCEELDLLEHHG